MILPLEPVHVLQASLNLSNTHLEGKNTNVLGNALLVRSSRLVSLIQYLQRAIGAAARGGHATQQSLEEGIVLREQCAKLF